MLIAVELRGFDYLSEELKDKRKLGYLNEGLRYVEVPNYEMPLKEEMENDIEIIEYALEKVWEYGQNEVQPKEQRSLMVGDVVRLNDEFWKVEDVGWSKIN